MVRVLLSGFVRSLKGVVRTKHVIRRPGLNDVPKERQLGFDAHAAAQMSRAAGKPLLVVKPGKVTPPPAPKTWLPMIGPYARTLLMQRRGEIAWQYGRSPRVPSSYWSPVHPKMVPHKQAVRLQDVACSGSHASP